VVESPLCSIPLAPEDILLRREAVEQVREAIRHLPPLLREIVELRDIEGLSYHEIATILSRPVGTVMSRLYRGRNLLRTYLVEPPQRPDGTRDTQFGIREIAAGTGGGETLYQLKNPIPVGSNIEVRNNTTHGILKVTLRAGAYDWRFIPVPGETFTDSGTGTCHGKPS